MMNEGRPRTGAYEVRYRSTEVVVIRTHYWIFRGEGEYQYWPKGNAREETKDIALRTCQRVVCLDRRQHSHDVHGQERVPTGHAVQNQILTPEEDLEY
jgi:hypothetical protein